MHDNGGPVWAIVSDLSLLYVKGDVSEWVGGRSRHLPEVLTTTQGGEDRGVGVQK